MNLPTLALAMVILAASTLPRAAIAADKPPQPPADNQPLAPMSIPGGGAGIGPKVYFGGLRTNAMKLTVLLDASKPVAALPGYDTYVETTRCVDPLRATQSLSLIVFQDGKATAMAEQFVAMTPANKRQAYDFAKAIKPAGAGDPTAALKLAFAQKPQVIILASAGDLGPDPAALPKLVRELNADNRVRLITLSLAKDNTAAEKILTQLANENGGTFKIFEPEQPDAPSKAKP